MCPSAWVGSAPGRPLVRAFSCDRSHVAGGPGKTQPGSGQAFTFFLKAGKHLFHLPSGLQGAHPVLKAGGREGASLSSAVCVPSGQSQTVFQPCLPSAAGRGTAALPTPYSPLKMAHECTVRPAVDHTRQERNAFEGKKLLSPRGEEGCLQQGMEEPHLWAGLRASVVLDLQNQWVAGDGTCLLGSSWCPEVGTEAERCWGGGRLPERPQQVQTGQWRRPGPA